MRIPLTSRHRAGSAARPGGPQGESGEGPAGGRETRVPATCHLHCTEQHQEVRREVCAFPARREPALSLMQAACSAALALSCTGSQGC